MAEASDTVLVKRYAGSRLYDTVAARYVTADEIATAAKMGRQVTVRDAQTGEDVTPSFLRKAMS
jgi:polyhydroxyalkanoate synthesis regulator protein